MISLYAFNSKRGLRNTWIVSCGVLQMRQA